MLTMVDGLEFGRRHVPPSPPTSPALITQVTVRPWSARSRQFSWRYIPGPSGSSGWIRTRADRVCSSPRAGNAGTVNPFAVILVPPLGETTCFEGFQEIIAALRAPDGCPWDREQTHLSLRTHPS